MYEPALMLRLGAVFLLFLACSHPPASALPVLGTVPAFELTDQAGAPFGSKALDGKVWVANFIFTRCPNVCPAFTAKMAAIQKGSQGLGEAVHLVTFTVDPEFDTPPKLADYAKLHEAGPRWTFLTGPRAALEAVVVKGMMQAMVKGDGTLAGIAHGSYFVLVDRQRAIRGFYRFSDEDSVPQVLRDVAGLTAEK